MVDNSSVPKACNHYLSFREFFWESTRLLRDLGHVLKFFQW